MRRHLPFAGQQQSDVRDAERVEALRIQRPPIRQEHPVSRWTRAGVQTGRATVGRGLDDIPALLQLFLPFVQNPAEIQTNKYVHQDIKKKKKCYLFSIPWRNRGFYRKQMKN